MRPLKDLKLPVSEYTAKVVTYLTRGETKRVDLAQFEGAEFEYIGTDMKMKNVPIDSQQKRSDNLLFLGVKELKDKSGNSIEIKKEAFDDLPDEDTRFLLLELNKAFAGTLKVKKK